MRAPFDWSIKRPFFLYVSFSQPIHRAEKSLINSPDETAARALCCVDFYLDFFARERTPSINEWNCALMTYFLKSLLSHFGDKSTRKWPLPNKGSRHWKPSLKPAFRFLIQSQFKQVCLSWIKFSQTHCQFFEKSNFTAPTKKIIKITKEFN